MPACLNMPEIWVTDGENEIGLWEDSIVESGNDIMFAINIPQEAVTIPETIDGIRAAMGMQRTREDGTAMTNRYLKIGKKR